MPETTDPTLPEHPVRVTTERHGEPTNVHEMVGDDWFLVMCGRYDVSQVASHGNGTVVVTLKLAQAVSP